MVLIFPGKATHWMVSRGNSFVLRRRSCVCEGVLGGLGYFCIERRRISLDWKYSEGAIFLIFYASTQRMGIGCFLHRIWVLVTAVGVFLRVMFDPNSISLYWQKNRRCGVEHATFLEYDYSSSNAELTVAWFPHSEAIAREERCVETLTCSTLRLAFSDRGSVEKKTTTRRDCSSIRI